MTRDALIDALKALAHPVRYRILEALIGGERNVSEIEDVSEIGQPALSQQLAVLRSAGLVQTRKAAKLVFYRLDDTALDAVTAAIGGFSGAAAAPEVRAASSGAANFARLG